MKKEDLAKCLKILGLAYRVEFSKDEAEIYYDALSEFDYEHLKNVISDFIKISKYLPKLSQLIEACEEKRLAYKQRVVDYMASIAYFRNSREYEKACAWIGKRVMPEFFENDFKKYEKMMKDEKAMIGYGSNTVLGSNAVHN